ncbi:MAG: phenylacetate-CoA ligase [Cognaticolwellia sp.]|jgi:phenylacetate-CoA ligase
MRLACLLGTQFLQKELLNIEVLVTCNSDFTDLERSQLIRNTKERLGNTMDVTITVVDNLIRTKNGKIRQAICDL